MTDRDSAENESVGEPNALLSRLRLIEDQPLQTRAAAFAQIHEELQSALDRGDSGTGS